MAEDRGFRTKEIEEQRRALVIKYVKNPFGCSRRILPERLPLFLFIPYMRALEGRNDIVNMSAENILGRRGGDLHRLVPGLVSI
ncbi:hypothetical protein GCM10009765_59450 [Fodinicola feengrottensis]|uniref:Uncharacterized protein n=1 Tax=Fodinicola feengrottensis TaxID=435914 RepID=A0ABP4UGH4_9ACTN